MFEALEDINERPEPFQYYTAEALWNDKHTSKQMLTFHLNETIDLSSRKKAFIDRSVEWIVSHFHVGKRTCIADFGCGPGLYTTKLAEKGAVVTGIDFSERSIAYAKNVAERKKLSVTYVQQNYIDFVTENRFDLIVMIMCDFCALSPAQRNTMVGKFHQCLKPGGAVLLDVYSLHAFNQIEEVATYAPNQLDGFWSSNNYYGFLNTFKYEEDRVVLDKYTIIEKKRTRVVYNWLQYFSPDSLRTEFEGNGFKVEAFYSDVAGTAYSPESTEFAVVARKME